MSANFVLAIHGGAGTIARGATGGDEAPYHDALKRALGAGLAVLRANGCAIDAVQAAVTVLEDEPLFNAGHGAVLTADARHELDASIMDGATLAAGAVAGVCTIKNPVAAARAVLQHSGCVLLAGAGAERFAREQGIALVPETYFSTPKRVAQLAEAKRLAAARGSTVMLLDHQASEGNDGKFGTVGAVALDAHGHLAAAVSTGGLTNKRPGRIGDTPLVGAGIYANDATCAVAATGTGEHFLRACVAHDIHARMHYTGASLEAAAHAAIHTGLSAIGGQGGIITVDAQGNIAMPFNTVGMYRGVVRADGVMMTQIFA